MTPQEQNPARYAILGFGTVGKATHKFIRDNCLRVTKPHLYVFDLNTKMAAHLNSKLPHLLTDRDRQLEAVFVCVSIPQGLDNVVHTNYHAEYLHKAIAPVLAFCKTDAPIFVRSTVTLGTMDVLQDLLGNRVYSWPEFNTEASMRKTFRCKAPILGAPIADNEWQAYSKVSRLFSNSSLSWMFNLSKTVVSNRQAEFLKLAHNVQTATEVRLRSELLTGAISVGMLPHVAESTIDMIDTLPPTFGSWMIGGSCLPKDLWLWDNSTSSSYGQSVTKENSRQGLEVLRQLELAWALYRMQDEQKHLTIVGLEDAPGSAWCNRSPALLFLEQIMEEKPGLESIVVVDKPLVKKRFLELVRRNAAYYTDYSPGSLRLYNNMFVNSEYLPTVTNIIVLAQRDPNKVYAPYKMLLSVLKRSQALVKLVFNPSMGYLTEEQYIEASKWGAVFVDGAELKRFTQWSAILSTLGSL